MSATVRYESHRAPAGILALLVHGIFFSLLYFGLNWNSQAYFPATMSVQLWSSLPDQVVAPPAEPKIEAVVPPPQPEKINRPDIVIPEKKKPVPVEAAKPGIEEKKPVPKIEIADKPKPEKTKSAAEKLQARRLADKQAALEKAAQAKQAEQAALEKAEQARQAEQAAATGQLVDEYQARIRAKIRRNIVMPPDVANDARAEFLVTLLPGGTVLNAQQIKSSGNVAYDNAVERAILKSDPLPLPPDVTLFNRFRELDLVFKPAE
ncbi:MAG: TonB C-terminal domain-containing protein [Gallionella sp.]